MEIKLKTPLTVNFRDYEDKGQAQLLADLVDRRLLESRDYQKRINDILVEIAHECLNMLPN